MKIISWNVNSLNARSEYVSQFLDAEEPDILCIQELKLPDERMKTDLFLSRGYQVAFFGQPRWNGVLIASKYPIDAVHRGLAPADEGQSRLIAVETAGLKLINLYCPQGQAESSPKFAYKLRFYDALIAWIAENYQLSDPLIALGDFNIAPEASDLWDVSKFTNVPTYHPQEHVRWKQLLEWGFVDAGRPFLGPNAYTFWDYRAGCFPRDRGMRIDHFLATPSIVSQVASARVHREWRKKRGDLKASDHAPVELLLKPR